MTIPPAVAPAVAGLGIGLALAGAPGPVQAVLVAEAARGGIGRGLRALVGASLTFGSLLMIVALGFALATPSPDGLRLLRLAGGGLLLWLALDAFRSSGRPAAADERAGLPPAVRGSLAVALNPGAWLFLGAVASPLTATATLAGGTSAALLTAAALMAGTAAGDGVVVVLAGAGLRRASLGVGRVVRRGLAVLLGALGGGAGAQRPAGLVGVCTSDLPAPPPSSTR